MSLHTLSGFDMTNGTAYLNMAAVEGSRWRAVGRHGGVVLAGLTVLTAAVACNDTRMSVEQFLAQEEQAAFASTQPAATQPSDKPAATEPLTVGRYRLRPDDVLNVTVAGLEAAGLPNVFTARVNRRGELTLPSVGRVSVGGLAVDEAEEAIQSQYAPNIIREAQVSIEIATYGTLCVNVVGDVRMAANVQFQAVEMRRDRTSVLGAVMAAGGPVEFGGRVTLIPARDPDQAFVYDLANRADLIRAARTGVVQEGDLLIVDSRPNDAVYVQGLVNAPGPIPMPRNKSLSVLQAISTAGGTMHAFQPSEATLMRRKPNGEHTRVKLRLDKMLDGTAPDIALAAGDMLIVPHNAATRFEEFLAKSFQVRLCTGIETTYNPWTLYYIRKDDTVGGGFFDSLGAQLTNQISNLGVITPTPAAPGRP